MTEPGDLLEGAQAIAEYLASLGGSWNARRVYHLMERNSGWPIWNEPGIGLMARKSGLEAHIVRREAEAIARQLDSSALSTAMLSRSAPRTG
jgi:hypothetical protein